MNKRPVFYLFLTCFFLFSCANPESDFIFHSDNSSGNKYVDITDYVGKSSVVVIPKKYQGREVRRIRDGAFANKNIKKVKFPKTLEIIQKSAFAENQIKKIVFPEYLYSVEDGAFYNNELVSVKFQDYNFRKVGEYAFAYNNIEKLSIPDSVFEIGKGAFSNNRIIYLKLPGGLNLQIVKESAFENNLIETVRWPAYLEEIEKNAFKNNRLTSLNLPSTIKFVDEDAFAMNPLTESDDFEWEIVSRNAVFISGYKGSSSSIIIPKEYSGSAVTGIKQDAFMDKGLDSVELQKGLNVIGSDAFKKNNITKIEIPFTVRQIGEGAFGMNPLKEIIVNSVIKQTPQFIFHVALKGVIPPGKYVYEDNEWYAESARGTLISFDTYQNNFLKSNKEELNMFLSDAVRQEDIALLERSLSLGADVKSFNYPKGNFLVSIVLESEQPQMDILRILMDNGAEVKPEMLKGIPIYSDIAELIFEYVDERDFIE
jgi:putative transposon-encoded protein